MCDALAGSQSRGIQEAADPDSATTSHQDLLDYFKTHPWFNGKNGSDKDETERIKQEITASFELCEKLRSLPQDKRSQIEAIINS